MNKKKDSIRFVFLFLLLIAVMDYPFIRRIITQREQSAVIIDYNSQVNDIGQSRKEQYLAAAREYNHSLTTGLPAALEIPFSESEQSSFAVENPLVIDDSGVIAAIEIPKANISLPVYYGTSGTVLEEGAGYLEGSSLPVGGAGTHTCIAAHRGLPGKRMFTDLDQVEEGDLFFIEVLGEKLAYQVYQVDVVLPEELEALKIQAGEDLATLITCTPYGVNTHRIYVHGTRIPYEDEWEYESDPDPQSMLRSYWWVALTAVLLIWMGIILYFYNRKPGKHDRKKQR